MSTLSPGTIENGIVLAKQRFAQIWPFDLHQETWETLFTEHRPCYVLESIKKSRKTRNHTPDAVYRGLLYWIGVFEEQEQARKSPLWPPPHTNQI